MLPIFAYRTIYKIARIIPVLFFLGVYSPHAEEVSWRSQPHAVLKIFVFLEGSVAGITSNDWGEGGRGGDLLIHIISTQLNLTLCS